ncbi:MAG: efflux RND transporter permease subunit [Thermoplasmata archaeon]|nr:efflux RND transporter permease subunit [Thermoplasmata archaeon]
MPELDMLFARWGYGESGPGAFFGGQEGSNIGTFFIKVVRKKDRDRSVKDMVKALRPKLASYPGAKVMFSTEDPMAGVLFGGGKKLQIQLLGNDLEVARRLAQDLSAALGEIEGVKDIEISRKEGKPELQIEIDRKKASDMGLNVSALARTVETVVSGRVATKYRAGEDEYDIFVRFREEDRANLSDISNIKVTTPSGRQIALMDIANISEERGPISIQRDDEERVISVSANIVGRSLGHVVADAKKKIAGLEVPDDFTVNFAGEMEEMEESFRVLLLAFVLGIILVYMVMASQFESLRDPFIIMFAVPFSTIGVIWALLLTGFNFSVMSFIGIIMLVGIVVNNGIVLISYINILRQRGMSVAEAIVTSGHRRLRPVLMTTFTTVLALVPIATFTGEGSENWQPLGVTVIAGLLVSMLVTLILVPTLYASFEERRERRKKRVVIGEPAE